MYRRYSEIGRSGVNWNSGQVYEDFLTQLQGINGIKIYREMSDNDAIVGAALQAIEQTFREMQWGVKGKNKENKKFLQENMTQMSQSWEDSIFDSFSMLKYGWSFSEIVYKRDKLGKIRWKKIALRKQDSFDSWEMTDCGEILGLWQIPAPNFQQLYIPLYIGQVAKALLFRTRLDGDNPEGRSILRPAYRAWYFKKNIEEIEAIGCERDLAGVPVISPPPDFDDTDQSTEVQNQVQNAKAIVANLRRDEQDGVYLPAGWTLQLLSSGGKRQFDTTAVINRWSKAIAASMLAEFILLGMERTGSYALSQDLTDMFFLSLEGWADSICNVYNRYAVPSLFQLNGVNNELPWITHTRVAKHNINDISNYVSKLAGVQALDIDDSMKKYLKKFARLNEFKEGGDENE